MRFIAHRQDGEEWVTVGTYDAPTPADAVGMATEAMDEDDVVVGCYGIRPEASPEGEFDLYRVNLGPDGEVKVISVDVC